MPRRVPTQTFEALFDIDHVVEAIADLIDQEIPFEYTGNGVLVFDIKNSRKKADEQVFVIFKRGKPHTLKRHCHSGGPHFTISTKGRGVERDVEG
jgi:hypothetical protein